MSQPSDRRACSERELVSLYALDALSRNEAAELEAHLATCAECREELEALRPTVETFVAWPTDVLRPSEPLWDRLAARIATETGEEPLPAQPRVWTEPEWDVVAPGISCKLLATDEERAVVSMLVRLEPKTAYPPHRHAGVEELHLLDGVLIVDEKTLHPGDYIHALPGSADALVYSETGCTCVLITSSNDELG